MKDTLEFIIKQLVTDSEAVSIEEKQEEAKTIFIIHVNQEDIGRIIGKHGRIIKAIRDLIKVMAIKQNLYVDVTLAEE